MTSAEFGTTVTLLETARTATEAARLVGAKLLEILQDPRAPGTRGEAQFSPQCLDSHRAASDAVQNLVAKLGQQEFSVLAEAKSSLEKYAQAAVDQSKDLDDDLKKTLVEATKAQLGLNDTLKAKLNSLLVADYSALDWIAKVAALFDALSSPAIVSSKKSWDVLSD